MSLEKIKNLSGTAVYVAGDDIDTDRIIPARFMKCVTFEGLGEYAFYDSPVNKPAEASILISDNNFGCGSSREHAPQALYHWGIRGIIAKSFAEIFFGNCTTLGIVCVATTQSEEIGQLIEENPGSEVNIDIEQKTIKITGKINQELGCEIPDSTRAALINGEWDPISFLLEDKELIKQKKEEIPNFLSM